MIIINKSNKYIILKSRTIKCNAYIQNTNSTFSVILQYSPKYFATKSVEKPNNESQQPFIETKSHKRRFQRQSHFMLRDFEDFESINHNENC